VYTLIIIAKYVVILDILFRRKNDNYVLLFQ